MFILVRLKDLEALRAAFFYGSLQTEAVKREDCLYSVIIFVSTDGNQYLLPNSVYVTLESQIVRVKQVFGFVFHRAMDDILIS